MLAAEDGDREAGALPVGAEAQVPPTAYRVEDDDRNLILEQLLDPDGGGPGLAGTFLAEDAEGLRRGAGERDREGLMSFGVEAESKMAFDWFHFSTLHLLSCGHSLTGSLVLVTSSRLK